MNPTILIGLDGMTFSILDPLMETGIMPFLREFTQTAARAELLSTVNPLTPPAWIAMITGQSPGYHGVFDFIWAQEREKDVYFTLYNFLDIQCETIWSIVSRQNGRAGSLNFPMMSPPPKVNGYIVPGLVSWKHLRRNIHPQELYEQFKMLPGFNVRELAWDFDLEKKAERGVPHEEFESWIEFHTRREEQWFEVLRHLMKHHPCDLTAVLFDGVDKLLHMGWRFLDPKSFPQDPSPWERKIRALCQNYFRNLDGFLAEIVEQAGPETGVFIASDHGFGPSRFVFRVNSWLHSQGYLNWRGIEDLDDKSRQSAQKLVDKHFVLLDWDKTTAYARSTTSNGIYIRVATKPGDSGVPPEKYEEFRQDLMDKLLAICHPETEERIIQRVLTREEAFPGPHNAQAPDLTLVMSDRSFISILNKAPIVLSRQEIEGTHYPEGIFMARGPGVRQGATLPQFSIIDVAPTLLYNLGLPIPSDFEGRAHTGIFEPSYLEKYPLQIGDPTQPPESSLWDRKGGGAEIEEDIEIFKQLRALGYVE